MKTATDLKNSPNRPENAWLAALWHDARGEWEDAHRLVQDDTSLEAAHIHAYLHRKEGDAANARYWYTRAGQPFFEGTLDEEWTSLVTQFLQS